MKTEEMVVDGGPSPYEPAEGGLGFEIFRCLKIHENKIAQSDIDTGDQCTYGEMLTRSIRVALYLQSKNLKKEDLVCICSHNQINVAIPFFASKFIDVNYSSIEPTMPEEDLVYLLDYVKPKVLFATEEVESKIEKCLKEANINLDLIIFGKSKKYNTFEEIIESKSGEDIFTPVFIKDLQETAVIFFSSGTTGKPKGICCNHFALLSQSVNCILLLCPRGVCNLSNFTRNLGFPENGPELVSLNYSPLYWVSGLVTLLLSVFTGSNRVVGSVFESRKTWKALHDYKVTFLFLPPGQIVDLYLGRCENETSDYLELISTGGGPVRPRHMQFIEEMFPKAIAVQIYGMTELACLVTSFNIRDPASIELQKKYPESCGQICYGIAAKVEDVNTGKAVGLNEQGELCLKSKYLMNGYLKMDSSSSFDSEGWFKTGDLVILNDSKCLIIIDRIKEIILYTLYNIRPSVIEEILAKHPAVYESCVVGIPHIKDNEHPVGIIVLKEEYRGKVTSEEILSFVNEKVPADRYKIRGGIKIVEEMIKTPTGKLKKADMKKKIIEGKM